MTDEEAATLESVMGDKLRELGYPVGDAAAGGGDPPTPDGDHRPPARATTRPPLAMPSAGEAPAPSSPGRRRRAPSSVGAATSSRPHPRHGEGRDYSDLGRLIQKRGSPASRRDRKVALTFDDGPVLQTHRVLETLERYGARGTFFLVGHKFDGHQSADRAAPERRP